jgi:hypothetical protein
MIDTRPTSVAPRDAFLAAEDLDDLLQKRQEISSLTPDESERVRSVIRDWSDHQAVAKLRAKIMTGPLFHDIPNLSEDACETCPHSPCTSTSNTIPYPVEAEGVKQCPTTAWNFLRERSIC